MLRKLVINNDFLKMIDKTYMDIKAFDLIKPKINYYR